jgi:hypothetical protein
VAVSAPDAQGEMRVRPLSPNEPVPAGARAAILVALESGQSLFGS